MGLQHHLKKFSSHQGYEYTETPLPDDDRIARLEKENTDLRKSNLDTQEAILELYEMLMGTPTT